MKVTDSKRLDTVYDASLAECPETVSAKRFNWNRKRRLHGPYSETKPSEFMDNSIIAELERKGFFAQQ